MYSSFLSSLEKTMASASNHKNKNNKSGRIGRGDPVNSHLTNALAQLEYQPSRPAKKLQAQSANQKLLISAINTSQLIFATGPAGTGKTYVAVTMACEAFTSKRISKIVLTRPAIEAAGEKLGFLPGELDEKFAPYIEPVRQIMKDSMGAGQLEYALKSGQVEPLPLAFMRGRTFNDAWIIVDEAQNTTPEQMKMLLTRVGQNCKVMICGDLDQSDIQGLSGMGDAIRRTGKLDEVSVVEFSIADCVRSGFVKSMLGVYSRQDESSSRPTGLSKLLTVNLPAWIKTGR